MTSLWSETGKYNRFNEFMGMTLDMGRLKELSKIKIKFEGVGLSI